MDKLKLYLKKFVKVMGKTLYFRVSSCKISTDFEKLDFMSIEGMEFITEVLKGK